MHGVEDGSDDAECVCVSLMLFLLIIVQEAVFVALGDCLAAFAGAISAGIEGGSGAGLLGLGG